MKLFYTVLCLFTTVIAQAQAGKVPIKQGSSTGQLNRATLENNKVPIKGGSAGTSITGNHLSATSSSDNKVPVKEGGSVGTTHINRPAGRISESTKGPSGQELPIKSDIKVIVPAVPFPPQQGTPPNTIVEPPKTSVIKREAKN
ncbi:hypothetical protein HGH93_22675 [Chitinophaga polysaccharea]|uniref:hypothetical protein n=1 Tax=Chitinophaga TaxID=79328 RepID=UPI001455D71A|nr:MULTISPECIES: hypothetical protein [Chitinophaga]NLR60926.1 hypothetical protein [Chitinophaga polysaccharea]NLU94700.1 hypothetical protein [Chitinophaga sp. Ak27]